MTDNTPDQDGAAVLTRQVHYTADLLRSLQDSIHRLRNEAEELREQLETAGADEVTGAKAQISKLEGLIRDCQKVEKVIAEQSTEFTRMLKSEHELDLVAARAAVERGLACLRAAIAPELLLE
jgi:chromosome segregation ATPase